MNKFKNKSFDCFKFSKNQEYYWIFGLRSAKTILSDVINNYLVSVEDLLNCYDPDFSELKNLLEESIFSETNKDLTIEGRCYHQKKLTNSETNYFCCTPIAEWDFLIMLTSIIYYILENTLKQNNNHYFVSVLESLTALLFHPTLGFCFLEILQNTNLINKKTVECYSAFENFFSSETLFIYNKFSEKNKLHLINFIFLLNPNYQESEKLINECFEDQNFNLLALWLKKQLELKKWN